MQLESSLSFAYKMPRLQRVCLRFITSSKSQVKKVGKNSLYEFMDYLENAYCVFSVPVFKHSFNERIITTDGQNMYKIDNVTIKAIPAHEWLGKDELKKKVF